MEAVLSVPLAWNEDQRKIEKAMKTKSTLENRFKKGEHYRMTEQEKQRAAYAMLYLVRCAALGIKPGRKQLGRMNLKQVYQYARFHSLTAMTYMALEAAEGFPNAAENVKSSESRSLKKRQEDCRKRGHRHLQSCAISSEECFRTGNICGRGV